MFKDVTNVIGLFYKIKKKYLKINFNKFLLNMD